CDVDGTLAHMQGRRPFDWHLVGDDALDEVVADILRRYMWDHKIILLSGRSDECRDATKRWLRMNKVPYDALHMRRAGDFRPDTVVKREIYDAEIKDRFTIRLILEDRSSMVKLWRSLDLTCFQVADGDF